MPSYVIYCLKRAPFLRIVIFLCCGIIIQWHFQPAANCWYIVAATTLLIQFVFLRMALFTRFRYSFVEGVIYFFLFTSLGALLILSKDIRNDSGWIGHNYSAGDALVISIEEPLSEKPKSFKTIGSVKYIIHNDRLVPTKGKLFVYFRKDTAIVNIVQYGTVLIFKRPIQLVRSQGNPGGFNFQEYALFQGITHQVYLQANDIRIVHHNNGNWISQQVFQLRNWVLGVLRSHIKSPVELGLAEALLIGYKDDLDKTLVQSYSNTGVVHVIAISGLHLGLIYLLLGILCKPLAKSKKLSWLKPVLIIFGLWCFSLLAGAQPSVLRSAVMFSCIVIGETIDRRSSIYNTLSFSAFLLLCFNPLWLWDVGFQLSYSAVLSIILFMRPVYNLIYFKNRIVDFFWKLNAVTLAAQILTTPLSIYHFGQFPNYFFLTNFIAVPLSSIILLGEIILCALSLAPAIANELGKILEWMIGLMNQCVQNVESLPFSIWGGLQLSILQLLLFYLFIATVSYAILEKSKAGLRWALFSLLGFMSIRSWSFFESNRQLTLIIYNIPQKPAMDFLMGRNCYFFGDSTTLLDFSIYNNCLKPCRVKYRATQDCMNPGLSFNGQYISFADRHIIVAGEQMLYHSATVNKPTIDVLIIPGNSRVQIQELAKTFHFQQIVFDPTVTSRKLARWQRVCDSLHIPHHDVSSKGAFVMTLR